MNAVQTIYNSLLNDPNRPNWNKWLQFTNTHYSRKRVGFKLVYAIVASFSMQMARKYNITYNHNGDRHAISEYLSQIRNAVTYNNEAIPVQVVVSFIGNIDNEIASIANSDYCGVVEKLTDDEITTLARKVGTMFVGLYRFRNKLWDHV